MATFSKISEGVTVMMEGNLPFPATQVASADANTLDDYEEGTWTPTITATTNDHTYTTQVGLYTKIGRAVHLQAFIVINSAGTTSGNVQFTNFPFTTDATTNAYGAACFGEMESLGIAANSSVHGYVPPNSTYVQGRLADATTGCTNLQFSEITAGGIVSFTVTFFV